jgi:hypothetical protein
MRRPRARSASFPGRVLAGRLPLCLAVVALTLGSLLLTEADAGAAPAGPVCPGQVGDFELVGNGLQPHGAGDPLDVLSCTYRSAGFGAEGGTQVQFTVSWQVADSDAVAFVGAAPCTGTMVTQRSDGSLSVGSGDRKVGSFASAAKIVPGRSSGASVPEEFAPVITTLVAAAEPLALSCQGDQAPPTTQENQAPLTTPASMSPTGRSDSSDPTPAEILIAAGLIMTLLTGGLSLPALIRLLGSRSLEAIPAVTTLADAALGNPATATGPNTETGGSPPEQPPAAPFLPLTALLPVTAPPAPPSPPPTEPVQQAVVTTGQVDGLENTFTTTVTQRLTEGYWVRNPNLVAKAWNTFTHPWWGSHSGQCGEFADNGMRWMSDYVHDQFGPGAVVDVVYMARRSVFVPNPDTLDTLDAALPMNHAATRVILPDGRRYIMDFWEAMGRSQGVPAKLVPENVWAARWAGQIPEAQISRTTDEIHLREQVLTVGEQRAFTTFRHHAARTGQGAQAETLIRSWTLDPW